MMLTVRQETHRRCPAPTRRPILDSVPTNGLLTVGQETHRWCPCRGGTLARPPCWRKVNQGHPVWTLRASMNDLVCPFLPLQSLYILLRRSSAYACFISTYGVRYHVTISSAFLFDSYYLFRFSFSLSTVSANTFRLRSTVRTSLMSTPAYLSASMGGTLQPADRKRL